ncbi:hypothetical protein BU17DRAFT_102334 [Hysterangium stoloniferum]|nr:hypothetical protein BU17DRAFT_102334 [Hysterangium stoloniferum]
MEQAKAAVERAMVAMGKHKVVEVESKSEGEPERPQKNVQEQQELSRTSMAKLTNKRESDLEDNFTSGKIEMDAPLD